VDVRTEIETNFPASYRAIFICCRWLPTKKCGAANFLRPAIEYHLERIILQYGSPKTGYRERRMLAVALCQLGLRREARRITSQSLPS
jgi:hypothetical protein